ncbi:MAG: hypothetical protein QM731_26525 [Chitinophagaceae bacterium]
MVGTRKIRIILITLLGVLLLVKPSLGMAFSDVQPDDEDSFINIQKLFKKRKQDLDEYSEITAGYRTFAIVKKTPPALKSSFTTVSTRLVTDVHFINIPFFIIPQRKVYLLSGRLSV